MNYDLEIHLLNADCCGHEWRFQKKNGVTPSGTHLIQQRVPANTSEYFKEVF